jgi:hypothetical protein
MIERVGVEIIKPYSRFAFILVRSYILISLAARTRSGIFLLRPWAYHLKITDSRHEAIAKRKNRFLIPNSLMTRIIINRNIRRRLHDLGIDNKSLVDDGDGWLGVRIIRPNRGDGYDFTKKSWGPGGICLSFWFPLVSFESQYSLKYLAGSENQDFESYLPSQTRHHPLEKRLKKEGRIEYSCHDLRKGQMIMFGPHVIHSEETFAGSKTRLSIEFRFHEKCD